MRKKGKAKVMFLNYNSNILEIKNSYVKIYDMNNPLKVENISNEDIVFLIYDSTKKLPDDFIINELKSKTLTIGIIINDDNQETIDNLTSLIDCYIMVSKNNINNIANIIDTLANITFPDGLINLDLDDIKSILEDSGKVGVEIASSREPNRLDAVNQIIKNIGENISKIDKMIIHCLSDNNLTLFEMEDIIKTIKEKVSENACVIYGNSIINEELYTKVTIIASFKE